MFGCNNRRYLGNETDESFDVGIRDLEFGPQHTPQLVDDLGAKNEFVGPPSQSGSPRVEHLWDEPPQMPLTLHLTISRISHGYSIWH